MSAAKDIIEWKKKIQIESLAIDILLSGKVPSNLLETYKKLGNIFQNKIAGWIENGVHLSVLRKLKSEDYFGKNYTIRFDFYDVREGTSIHIPLEKFANLFYSRMRKLRGHGGKERTRSKTRRSRSSTTRKNKKIRRQHVAQQEQPQLQPEEPQQEQPPQEQPPQEQPQQEQPPQEQPPQEQPQQEQPPKLDNF